MTTIIHLLEKPYIVWDSQTDTYRTVLAPSPLGALYNIWIEETGRIPEVDLVTSDDVLSLGKWHVPNRYAE